MNKSVVLTLGLVFSLFYETGNMAAQTLTLNECRQLALQSNKQTEINREQVAAAKDLKSAAMANFFPKISANGGYIWNEKDIVLMPDALDTRVGTIHANGGVDWKPESAMGKVQAGINAFATQMETILPGSAARISGFANGVGTEFNNLIGTVYGDLRDMLTWDVQHVFVGQVGLTQPIFVGGKIINTYKIAKSSQHIAEIKAENDNDELILKVDEAYWRVLSVEKKRELAQQYYDLIKKVESDVDALAEEGLATPSDQLKVKMKLAEAEQKLGMAEDGLSLSKMALCQLCGLELDYDIHVSDQSLNEAILVDTLPADMDLVLSGRKEIQMLEESEKIAKSTVMLAASTLMPNIVANAGYLVTNPNMQNGFANNFRGQFSAAVAVNIPIAHANDIYKVKAAKHNQKVVDLKLQEAREMITLQTTQSRQKVSDAQRKLARAISASGHAEENLRLAEEAWKEGMLSSTELLGAQTAWMNAETDRLDAVIELKMAQSTLNKHMGISNL